MTERVFALGSCRLHDPLMAAHRMGRLDYLNGRVRRKAPVFLHDVQEAVQFVRLARHEIAMPKEILPFAYNRGRRPHRRTLSLLEQAGYVMVECCTDKHYEAAGWTLNVNEIHGQLVGGGGAAAQEWWLAIDRQQSPSETLVRSVEAELGARWLTRRRLGDGHRQVLRELTLRYLSASEIAQGLERLRLLTPGLLLVVPHIAVHLPDGSYLAERLRHVEKTIEAARMIGLPFLDPRIFVERDGQSCALDGSGSDFHHYAADYMSVVGQEFVEALATTAGSRTSK